MTKIKAPKDGATFTPAVDSTTTGRAKDPNAGKSGNPQTHAHDGEKAGTTSGKMPASGKFVAPSM